MSDPKPPLSKERQQQARRRVLRTILLTGGVLGAALSGYLPLAYAKKQRLRPPGALDEKDFLASCIKCGQCVQLCPVQAIKLADLAALTPGIALYSFAGLMVSMAAGDAMLDDHEVWERLAVRLRSPREAAGG